VIHSFSNTPDGNDPVYSLTPYNGFLYGVTLSGGKFDNGSIYKIRPDGTGYVRLHDFQTRINGSNPYTSLYELDGYFYGMTKAGGVADAGVIFKMCDQSVVRLATSICAGSSYSVGDSLYTETGEYVNIFIAANGCDSIVYTDLTVIPNTNVEIGENYLFALEFEATSYQWLDCENGYTPIEGTDSYYFEPTLSGEYAIVIELDDCIDTSACITFLHVGLEDKFGDNQISIYPNPTNQKIHITSSVDILNVSVHNHLGIQITAYASMNAQSLSMDLGEQPNGIYWVTLQTEFGMVYKPIVLFK